jgi:hypothetical protein
MGCPGVPDFATVACWVSVPEMVTVSPGSAAAVAAATVQYAWLAVRVALSVQDAELLTTRVAAADAGAVAATTPTPTSTAPTATPAIRRLRADIVPPGHHMISAQDGTRAAVAPSPLVIKLNR